MNTVELSLLKQTLPTYPDAFVPVRHPSGILAFTAGPYDVLALSRAHAVEPRYTRAGRLISVHLVISVHGARRILGRLYPPDASSRVTRRHPSASSLSWPPFAGRGHGALQRGSMHTLRLAQATGCYAPSEAA